MTSLTPTVVRTGAERMLGRSSVGMLGTNEGSAALTVGRGDGALWTSVSHDCEVHHFSTAVILELEDDQWVARFIDDSLASQGGTPAEALRNFEEAWRIKLGEL